jgi:hypothetical protein
MNNKDFVSILNYYKLPVPKSKKTIRKKANQIMASKLCGCIKKVGPDEGKSIGICTKTIFNNKGYTRGKFKCKKRRFVEFTKTKKQKTRKTKI